MTDPVSTPKTPEKAEPTSATDTATPGVRHVKYAKSCHGDQNPKAVFRGGTKGERITMQLGDVQPVSQAIFEGLKRKHGDCFDEVDAKAYRAFQKRKAEQVEAARKKAAKDLAANRQAGPISTRG